MSSARPAKPLESDLAEPAAAGRSGGAGSGWRDGAGRGSGGGRGLLDELVVPPEPDGADAPHPQNEHRECVPRVAVVDGGGDVGEIVRPAGEVEREVDGLRDEQIFDQERGGRKNEPPRGDRPR